MTEQSDKPSVDGLMMVVEAFGQACKLRGVRQAQGKPCDEANAAIFDSADEIRAYAARLAALDGPLEQPQEPGDVVVTKDDTGAIVAVTRQDSEGRILSVVAEPDSSYSTSRVGQINKTALPEDGFDGSTVRVGPNHSTIEIWYDTEEQARAAHSAILAMIFPAQAQPLPVAALSDAKRAVTIMNAHTLADMVHADSDGPIEALHTAIDMLAAMSAKKGGKHGE